jgi:hypothetical protein
MKTEGLLLCFQQRATSPILSPATSPIFSQINVSHSVPLCSFEINFVIVLHLRGTFTYQELQKTRLIFDLQYMNLTFTEVRKVSEVSF